MADFTEPVPRFRTQQETGVMTRRNMLASVALGVTAMLTKIGFSGEHKPKLNSEQIKALETLRHLPNEQKSTYLVRDDKETEHTKGVHVRLQPQAIEGRDGENPGVLTTLPIGYKIEGAVSWKGHNPDYSNLHTSTTDDSWVTFEYKGQPVFVAVKHLDLVAKNTR